MKRLYRSQRHKVIAGVCGGVAEYLDIDPVLIRLVWAVLFFFGGIGFLGYIIAWVIIPLRIDSGTDTPEASEASTEVDIRPSYSVQLLIGMLLIMIGAVLLVREWWYFDHLLHNVLRISWKYLVPLLLMGIGIYIIIRGDRDR
jgi:phage shock protein C